MEEEQIWECSEYDMYQTSGFQSMEYTRTKTFYPIKTRCRPGETPKVRKIDAEDVKQRKKAHWHEILIKNHQRSLQNYVCYRCCPAGELSVQVSGPVPKGFNDMADHKKLQKVIAMHLDVKKEIEQAEIIKTCSVEKRK